MKPFYDLNRLICRCLEVLNILMAMPLGAFIYVVSEEYLSEALTRHHGPQGLYNNEIVVDITAIGLAIIGILYINGGIAQALDKRRFLEKISQSVEELDRSEDTSAAVTIIEAGEVLAPKKKRKAKKKAVKAAATRTVARKTQSTQPARKKAAKASAKKANKKTAGKKATGKKAASKKAAKKART